MKKILFYIILVFPFSVFAQVLSNAEQRMFNYRIVDLLEEYEFLLQNPTDRAHYEFVSLFEAGDTLIYNDLLGLSSKKKVTVEEYANLLYSNSNACKVVIKDVDKQEIVETDSHFVVDVKFAKYMQYYNKCGIVFDSEVYYKADHEIMATIAMDKSNGNVQIRTIKGNIKSEASPLPLEYRVFAYNDPRDKDVLVNDKNIEYNIFGQSFVDENAKVEIKDGEIALYIVQNDTNCNLYSFNYKNRLWRVIPKVQFNIGDIYKFSGEGYGNELLKSQSMLEYGLDFGCALIRKPKFKLNLFTGASFVKSNLEFEQGEFGYKYYYNAPSAADYDGETYRRYYEINNMRAAMEITQIAIPLYLDFDFQFTRRFSAYLQMGVKAFVSTKCTVKDFSADVKTYGVYPQYGNLVMENFKPNEFTNHTVSANSQDIETESMITDAFGGIGFRLNLFGSLYLDAAVNYQRSLTPVVTAEEELNLGYRGTGGSSTFVDESKALITYTCAGGEVVKPFTNLFSEIKRDGLKVSVGLLLKF